MLSAPQLVGQRAESIACTWLEEKGYCCLTRNFRRRIGEIDLIMLAPDKLTYVFVEVRYRSDNRFGGAVASITAGKKARLIRTAMAWLQKNASSTNPARIDVITVKPATTKTVTAALWQEHEILWIENAIEN